MSARNEIPAVSMSNTKKEMLDAYSEVKRRVETQKKELVTAEKARAEAENNVSLAVAEKEAESDPIKRLHELRGALGKELLALAERFEQEVQTFEQIRSAILNKRKELESLYGLEAAVGDLAELIAFQNEKKELFSQQVQQEKEIFYHEIQGQRTAWEQEKEAVSLRVEEARNEREIKWKREQEEYDYSLQRERIQRRDELEDELGKLTQKISVQTQAFEISKKYQEEELQRRLDGVVGRENVANDLQREIDEFSDRQDRAVQSAVEERVTHLTMEFVAQQALGKATHEGQCRVYQSRIDAFEKLVESQAQQIEQLSSSQDAAYQKVQDIASRAVDSARREIVFSPAPAQKSTEG